jgi:transposase
MSRPLSTGLRDRVVARVAAGETVRSVAAVFGVSVSSVVKWSQRWRATGSASPNPMGGKGRIAYYEAASQRSQHSARADIVARGPP